MDPNPAEQGAALSVGKRFVRKKMDAASTCFDSALQALALYDQQQWSPVRLGLDFLKTFLTFSPQWNRFADVGFRKHLGDLPSCIESEFEEMVGKIKDDADPVELGALRASLLEKIDHFKPKIRDAYLFLSGYAFQNTHLDPDVTLGSLHCSRLYDSLLSNCKNLHSVSSMSTPVYSQIQVIIKFLQSIQLRDVMFRHPEQFWDLCIQHGSVGICFAGPLFSCWVEGGGGAENLTAELSDLVQKIKPTTPPLLTLYLEAIKSQCYSLQKTLIEELVGIIVLASDESLEALCDCLVFLIGHRVKSPKDHDEDQRIEEIICGAASLSHSSSKAPDSVGQLLQQAELLRIKILLTELGESDSISKTRSGSINQGSRFLEKMILILHDIETLTTGEESPQSSLGDPYAKVSLDFYLTVIQSFLMELMSCGSGLIIRLKDQIHKLSEGSILFHKYSSILPLKNTSDMDLISGIMAGAACNAEAVHDFFHEYQVTENNINLISLLLSKFLENFEHLNSKMQDTYFKFQKASMYSFPKTLPGLAFVDSFLERLGGLANRHYSNESSVKPQIEAVLAELNFLRASLKLVKEKLNENPELIDLKRRFTMAAYQADYIIDAMFLLSADQCYSLWLSDVIDDMCLVKKDLIKFIEKNEDFVDAEDSVKTLGHETTQSDTPEVKELIVSLDDQENKITNLLMNGKPEEFMVGIVGMAGIGKTTLAKQVYDRPDVKKHFQKLAWCCISEEFHTREVLLKILRDINPSDKGRDSTDQQSVDLLHGSDDKSEGELLLMLRQNLMGKKYLIVMDDVWKEDAWNKLKLGIHKDSYGSRVLFTSRNETVLSAEKDHLVLHSPRPLEDEESWTLLRKKVFGEGNKYPKELMEVGKEIANSCKGVPLTVVTIAGLLSKTKREVSSWLQIKEGFSTHILDPKSQCDRALQLSYKHLPDYLKPCFLYFAAFRKDLEIPVKKLTRLWIAEGFIRKADEEAPEDVEDDCKEDRVDEEVGGKDDDDGDDDGDGDGDGDDVGDDDDDDDYYDEEDIEEDDSEDKVKAVEDVALDYVEDLISRCLIMSARRGSSYKLKTCKIHDLWHNLCSAKAKDDNFFESITGYADYYPSNTADHGLDLVPTSYPEAYTSKHRMSIFSKRNQFVKLKPSGPPLRTLLFFGTSDSRPTCPYDVSFIPRNFKILRVLDIESINMDSSFPEGIVLLDPLTYLAVGGDIVSVPSTIQKLWNLETFIVRGLKGKVALPSTIWSMPRLRHLNVYDSATLALPDESHESFSKLNNLMTLSSPSLSHWTDMEEIIKRAPQLRKLRCTFSPHQHSQNHMQFLDPEVLKKLESLKVLYTGMFSKSWELSFPTNLKKLSLRSFRLTWNCISSVGELPRLEVLTLVLISFDSRTWEMEEEKFLKLRILKLDSLELDQWVASPSNFQSLERLVLWSCEHLKAVPPAFGDNLTLQMIEMMRCSTKAERSLRHIEEGQRDRLQKKDFRVCVNDPAAAFRSSL